MLFSDNIRTDETVKRERESSFAFLERSSRPEIARVRDLLEVAVSNYARSELDELFARIRSDDEVAFRSATFELLLHESLHRLGFLLTPHPELGNGNTRRPDFLVDAPDSATFYLEAVLASSRDGTTPGAEAMKATTLDLLAQAPHRSFRVHIDSDGDPTNQPRARDLIAEVHAWLDTLDPEALLQSLSESGLEAMPTYQWRHEDWELTLRPLPMRPERYGTSTTLIGAFGGEGRRLDDWTPLRDAVKKKGRRYGDLDRPLVVAVNAESFHLDPIDELQALYGQEEYVEYVGRPDLGGRMRRASNGAWNGPQGPQARRVSAAWFFNDLTPYTVATRRSTLYVNPWAHIEAPSSLLQFPHARVVENRLVRADGIAMRELFGLTPVWPE